MRSSFLCLGSHFVWIIIGCFSNMSAAERTKLTWNMLSTLDFFLFFAVRLQVYDCTYSRPSHAFADLSPSAHAASSTAEGECASAERERPTAPRQPTLYLQAAVASGYWSVIKSLGPPQGQFISEVITPELYMTASVNHKCWISSLCTRNDVQRKKRWKVGEKEEAERERNKRATRHLQ